MKNIFKILCFIVLATLFAGCPNNNDPEPITPPLAYSEQYPIMKQLLTIF